MVQLALVVALVGAPYPMFVGDRWATPEQQDLVALDHPVVTLAEPSSEAVARAQPAPRAAPAPTRAPPPAAPPQAAPAQGAAAPPAAPATLSGGRTVLASWYGPGFYGNRTACGQTLTPSSWGVAHKTLPCGSVVSITYAGRTVTAPVIDRGPYIAGREVDLAAAVANALGFSGVKPIYLVIH